MDEVRQALFELQCAEQNFQYAEEPFIECAILALNAAQLKYNTLLHDYKLGSKQSA